MKDIAYARKLRITHHKSYAEIAEILGDRTESAVRGKLCAMQTIFGAKPRGAPKVYPTIVPFSVMEEQIHRALLRHATLTAAICGDPLPGYSALDRKRAA